MTLIETTELYAAVLRQLLPIGAYDTASATSIAKDVYAHAKALASVDLDAKRLFNVIDDIPADLAEEFEKNQIEWLYNDFHHQETFFLFQVE